MWCGYFRIKKATEISEEDKRLLLAMGQQTGNPNEITHGRCSLDSKQMIIEGIFPAEPTEGDIPFAVTEFEIFEGTCWGGRNCNTCNYLCANSAEWEE